MTFIMKRPHAPIAIHVRMDVYEHKMPEHNAHRWVLFLAQETEQGGHRVVQAKWLTSAYYSKIDSIRADTPIYQFIIGGFTAVLVLAWVLNRLSSSFGSGVRGGALAGFYLGVLVSFPTYHFIFLMFKGYPYSLVWINTIYGVVWYMIIGAVLAAIMKKPLAANTAG